MPERVDVSPAQLTAVVKAAYIWPLMNCALVTRASPVESLGDACWSWGSGFGCDACGGSAYGRLSVTVVEGSVVAAPGADVGTTAQRLSVWETVPSSTSPASFPTNHSVDVVPASMAGTRDRSG